MHPVKRVGRGVIGMGFPTFVVRHGHHGRSGLVKVGGEVLDERPDDECRAAVKVQVTEKDCYFRVFPAQHRDDVSERSHQGGLEIPGILIIGAEMNEGDVRHREYR